MRCDDELTMTMMLMAAMLRTFLQREGLVRPQLPCRLLSREVEGGTPNRDELSVRIAAAAAAGQQT